VPSVSVANLWLRSFVSAWWESVCVEIPGTNGTQTELWLITNSQSGIGWHALRVH
jgi:hypothetical protein